MVGEDRAPRDGAGVPLSHEETLAELRRLEASLAESAVAGHEILAELREQLTEATVPTGAGFVDVELDDEGLVSSMRFLPAAAQLSPEQLAATLELAIVVEARRPRRRHGADDDAEPIAASASSSDGAVTVAALRGAITAVAVAPSVVEVVGAHVGRAIAEVAREAQLRSLGIAEEAPA